MSFEFWDGHTWLDALPAELSAQRDLLRRLLQTVERDPRWRWLEVGCSFAEGRADAFSDLDLGIGVADDEWDAAIADLPSVLEALEPVIGALYHRLPQVGPELHLRAFVQYENGVQLDLVAVPAHSPKGRKPEHVMLHDPDCILAEPWHPFVLQATAATVYEWTFLGWAALADVAKYLRRGSSWEALERLHEARAQMWRLWAVAKGLPYPGFGVTEVLDHPEAGIPLGIERTASPAAHPELLGAACACAELLTQVARSAAAKLGASYPESFAAYVMNQLESLR